MKNWKEQKGKEIMLQMIFKSVEHVYDYSEKSVAFILSPADEFVIYPKSELYINPEWPTQIAYRKDVAEKSLDWTQSRFSHSFINSKIDVNKTIKIN